MEELLATNDIVILSLVQSLLMDANLDYIVLDQNMSILEGSLGIIPVRVMVPAEQLVAAKHVLIDSGLEKELTTRNTS